MKKTIEERFKEKTKPDLSGCILWTAAVHDMGYGTFGFRGRPQGAHRVSWILNFGEIPKNLWVLHKCDVRLCVNPDHLFLGTPKQNTKDMFEKGRAAVGERHGRSKIKKTDVDKIKILLLNNSGRKVAKIFGISESHVSSIKHGRKWVSE